MCGIFFIFNPDRDTLHDENLFKAGIQGISRLWHRGEEGRGALSLDTDKRRFYIQKSKDPVTDFLREGMDKLVRLFKKHIPCRYHLFQSRYKTTGPVSDKNAQPWISENGRIALAFNGNIANWIELKRMLEAELGAASFPPEDEMVDTDVLMRLIEHCCDQVRRQTNEELPVEEFYQKVFKKVDKQIDGACSLVMVDIDGNFVIYRDKYGFRPLTYLKTEQKSIIVASETVALPNVSRDHRRTITAGHIAVYNAKQDTLSDFLSVSPDGWGKDRSARCAIEHAYFGHVASLRSGKRLGKLREELGASLAQETRDTLTGIQDNAVVIAIPDTGREYAKGFANEAGIPLLKDAITVIDTVDMNGQGQARPRSFIHDDAERNIILDKKFAYDLTGIEGKDVVLVDDSIFRGNSSRKIIEIIKQGNPRSIRLVSGTPMMIGNCFYGINVPTLEELASYKALEKLEPETIRDVVSKIEKGEDISTHRQLREQIAIDIGLNPERGDSVFYLSRDRFMEGMPMKHMCTGCFSGTYPTECGRRLFGSALARRRQAMGLNV